MKPINTSTQKYVTELFSALLTHFFHNFPRKTLNKLVKIVSQITSLQKCAHKESFEYNNLKDTTVKREHDAYYFCISELFAFESREERVGNS